MGAKDARNKRHPYNLGYLEVSGVRFLGGGTVLSPHSAGEVPPAGLSWEKRISCSLIVPTRVSAFGGGQDCPPSQETAERLAPLRLAVAERGKRCSVVYSQHTW